MGPRPRTETPVRKNRLYRIWIDVKPTGLSQDGPQRRDGLPIALSQDSPCRVTPLAATGRKASCASASRQCTRCPAARPGAHGVDTRRHTRRLIAGWGAKRVGSRLRHFAARQACLSNRQVLSRTNHGVVFMGADSLVTVSMVTQQSITGVVHVRLAVRRPHTGPDLPAARAVGKGVLKCGAQGFGLA
jgi:hypothetical protein